MPELETDLFHHYRILRKDDGSLWELGRGAMGVTYKAEDTNLHTTVALKVINSLYLGNPTARERFIREARAAASLRHRNVAAVHHLGQDGQAFFYAMEFIDGVTVAQLVRDEGPQPWRRVLRYALQVAYALMAAHDRKLVHRDIKPDNLMLVAEAGPDDLVVKVIDFGLARSLAESGGSVVNLSGSGFIGTPLYASPEQCEEIAPDIRSDIYSLGVVIWYGLTGAPVFGGPLGKVFAQHIGAEPPWNKLPADLPESVRALLARMLAKNRADRPQTPAELRRELDDCLLSAAQVSAESLVADGDEPPPLSDLDDTLLEPPAPSEVPPRKPVKSQAGADATLIEPLAPKVVETLPTLPGLLPREVAWVTIPPRQPEMPPAARPLPAPKAQAAKSATPARRFPWKWVTVAIIVVFLAAISLCVPGFLRSRKRSQATAILNDARVIDAAIGQYSLENNMPGTATVNINALQSYFKPSNRLYEAASSGTMTDILGGTYVIDTYEKGVKVCPISESNFTDVIDDPVAFWGHYYQ